jgi:hypothetical protein
VGSFLWIRKELILKQNGDYIFEEKLNTKREREFLLRYKCCICGNIKELRSSEVKRYDLKHSYRLCKDNFIESEIGRVINDYTITDIFYKNGKLKCIVRCNRKFIRVYSNILENSESTTHNFCSRGLGMDRTRFKRIWEKMRDRTTNPNYSKYHLYGGRGISSEYYKNFIDFYDDLYLSYLKHCKEYGEFDTTLERMNVNKNYEKGNLTWATRVEQSSNLRKNIKFLAIHTDGTRIVETNIARFSRKYNLCQTSIRDRLHGKITSLYKGWNFTKFNNIHKKNL